jgi:hypothetical protein
MKQNDINMIQQYPFGQRTNPSSYLNHGNTVHNSYQMLNNPSGHPIDYRVNYLAVDKEPKSTSLQKVYPNNYALKPSSIHADQPSYGTIFRFDCLLLKQSLLFSEIRSPNFSYQYLILRMFLNLFKNSRSS